METKQRYLLEHNVYSRLVSLKRNHNAKLAEKLDRQLIDASIHAENSLPKHRDSPYSPELATLRKRFDIYRLIR